MEILRRNERESAVRCVTFVYLFTFLTLLPGRVVHSASVAYKACPLTKLTTCTRCPSGADWSSLTAKPNPTFPGAVGGGTFVAHPLGSVDPRPFASKLNKLPDDTLFSIDQCCRACSATKDCGYWRFRPTLGNKENKGFCDIFHTSQCSTSETYGNYMKWRAYDSMTVFSFRKCGNESPPPALSPPLPSPITFPSTLVPSPSPTYSPPPPVTLVSPSPPPVVVSPSPPPPSPQSVPYPPPPVASSYGHCPVFPSCTSIPFCPDTSTLNDLLADVTSHTEIKRGKILQAISGATGNTLLANVGYMSIGDCCQTCADRWQEDCWLWNWQHQPTADTLDRGECKLFVSQACAFMTKQGFLDQDVWDPTQPGYFTSVSPC